MLCQFADHSFDCCRLDRKFIVINKNLFCRAQEKDAHAEVPSKCNMLILLLLLSVM